MIRLVDEALTQFHAIAVDRVATNRGPATPDYVSNADVEHIVGELIALRARVEAQGAELAALRTAAQTLLGLKRGPRDSPYYARKQGAWDALAAALAVRPEDGQQ